jgi:hypothetical protein
LSLQQVKTKHLPAKNAIPARAGDNRWLVAVGAREICSFPKTTDYTT